MEKYHMNKKFVTIDGNEAAAYIAHKTNEVIAIYPITPSSPMGEWSDMWTATGRPNIWGTVPSVTEMQSEGGASGTVHGALQTGALTTTFTASQGLLLMIPNMYKIAGELTSTVFHVSARSIAAQALSIFGDHSDVMSVRQTGFALLASNNIQEVMDFALISQTATLESRVPFLHFFDGFRTSHEVAKIELIEDAVIQQMISDDMVIAHRKRGLTPDTPVFRGSAQNPDVYFQGRETVNPFYDAAPGIVQKAMDQFAKLTGREYHLFDYVGAEDAEKVIVLMGSGVETVHETVEYLAARGEKVGVVKVRLYRPFSKDHLLEAIPETVKQIAVLDRTKEPGSVGEPLYQDVLSAYAELHQEGKLGSNGIPRIIGGRYGLSSKEFTPAMVKSIFDEVAKEKPLNHFTIGIKDDVSNLSLEYDTSFSTEDEGTFTGLFYGLGADGTVGANKNSIKIIGEETDNHAQGYFVYDSKKSGSMTVSHLRFGKNPIRATYLVSKAKFIAVHQFGFLEKYAILDKAEKGATLLLNAPFEADKVWDELPRPVQEDIIAKDLKLYTIDGYKVGKETGMGGRINTIMQTCFFAISGIIPREQAIEKIKDTIKKTYGSKGDEIVRMNNNAVDQAVANMFEVKVPGKADSKREMTPIVSDVAPDYVKNVLSKMMAFQGDEVTVGQMPVDGTFPTGTAKWEKRAISQEIPVWDPDTCIQCGKCALACPHGVIRIKAYDKAELNGAPATFKSTAYKGKEFAGDTAYTIQVSPDDCTGCVLCVEVCPAKNKSNTSLKAINMAEMRPLQKDENDNWNFFLDIPEVDREKVKHNTVKGSQFLEPLFEFSGACAGCGETPYVKLVSQLFGDRTIIANATGCSSIYGGNLPTTPWTTNKDGNGPAWSNSLFEDNAEFGLGFRLTFNKRQEFAIELLSDLRNVVGADLADKILNNTQQEESDIFAQREYVAELNSKLDKMDDSKARHLRSLTENLIKKSVWIIGGDGWAYDIGYGGLDHVLASGENVNILVLDTEVYSNTGGQMSKATQIGAVAKFAANGKEAGKKDLAMMAMSYGNVYVAKVAMGANDNHTVKAFVEAEKYDGPSLIIAYSHCIAHGINMSKGFEHQKAAVQSNYWHLFRYNPELADEGKNPFVLDFKDTKMPLKEFVGKETRFKMLFKADPQRAGELLKKNQKVLDEKMKLYKNMAE
jgi:pyruvate-ferredoxin/flavodoxin oxidoreductase